MNNPPTLEVVIPSKQRADIVATAAAMFADPIIAVDRVEADAYRRALPQARLITHTGLKYLPQIRQWILDTVKADIIFQCDDDVKGFYCVVGNHRRKITDPAAVRAILLNAALNAHDAGTILFFFQHHPDVRKDSPFRPFVFTKTTVGYAQGYWRQEFNREIRYDSRIKTKANLDISLRVMAKRRIIWCDERFGFQVGTHLTAKGGLATYRTAEMLKEDIAILKKRFGAALQVNQFADEQRSQYVTKTRVKRR